MKSKILHTVSVWGSTNLKPHTLGFLPQSCHVVCAAHHYLSTSAFNIVLPRFLSKFSLVGSHIMCNFLLEAFHSCTWWWISLLNLHTAQFISTFKIFLIFILLSTLLASTGEEWFVYLIFSDTNRTVYTNGSSLFSCFTFSFCHQSFYITFYFLFDV